MQALSQSPFLQALGYAIAHSLWQVALLWIVVVLMNSLLKFSSHTRYKIALTAQLAGFAWFLITLQFYYTASSKALATAKELAIDNNVVLQAQGETFHSRLLNFFVIGERVLPYLSVAYIGLLIFLTIKWIRSYRFTKVIKTEGLHRIDVDWKLFVKRMVQHLEIKKEIKIYLSDIIKSPLTIGFLKPVILIPVASINHLTTEQLEAVILHELAHIKRSDYLINLIQSIIEIALFFNPFIQLLSKQIRKERENSCDDWVLQFQYNPTMYAEALLQIAYLQTNTAFAMQASGHDKGDLLSRVKRLLNKQEKIFNYKQQLIALVLMTGIFCSIAWFDPSAPTQVVSKNTLPEKKVVLEPLAAQVDNPFFNPFFALSKPLKDEVKKATEKARQEVEAQAPVVLDQAQQALTKVTPAVIDRINDLKLNFNNNMQKAHEEAKKELAKTDWVTLSKQIPFLDTATIFASVENAFDKKNFHINWNKLNESVAKAKVDINKLKLDKEVLKNTEFQNALNEAFAEVNQSLSNIFSEEKTKQPEKLSQQDELKQRRFKISQERMKRWREEKRSADSARKMFLSRDVKPHIELFRDSDNVDSDPSLYQTYVYTRPVYTEAPQAPLLGEAPVVPATFRYYVADDDRNAGENTSAMNAPSVETKKIVVTKAGEEGLKKEIINITSLTSPQGKQVFRIVIEVTDAPAHKKDGKL
ncbi:MAG: M56 family metallopeptidase [Ilyomonas sp.]